MQGDPRGDESMKLPSLSLLARESAKTYLRFPSVILVASIGTVASMFIIDHEGPSEPGVFVNMVMAASLGISFLTTLVLFAESRSWSQLRNILFQGGGLCLLIAYFFTLPD